MKWRRRRGSSESRITPPGKKPTADDFLPDAVNRAVLSNAAQHPATVFPLAGAVVAGLWSVVFGLTPVSLFTMLAGGFVGLFVGAILLAIGYRIFMRWVNEANGPENATSAQEPVGESP